MEFVGTGRRLAQGDVGKVARAIGMPDTASLLAFLEVEAAGRGFDGRNRPKILPEGHVFYRCLKAAKRELAVRRKLAWPKWKRDYPPTSDGRYARLALMIDVDRPPALMACSWGIGQVLGENYAVCGFPGVEAMVSAMQQGEYEQLMAVGGFMVTKGIPKLLDDKDLTKAESWEPVCRIYNGKAFKKNGYHTKIAAAYRKHKAGKPMALPSAVAPEKVLVLRKGMKGEAVRNLQADLVAYGLDPGPIDGRYGDKTEAAVRQFQADALLAVDGVFGPNSRRVLDIRLATRAEIDAPEHERTPPIWDGQAAGFGALIAAIVAALFGSRRPG